MSFELQIEFSGLCLFVVSRDGRRVGVAMPDARRRPNTGTMRHPDGTLAVAHAGYFRFDLGDLRGDIPAATTPADGPRYEVVHRFDREELDLALPEDRSRVGVGELNYPDFRRIDEKIKIIPGLFSEERPPNEVLMRMVLTGGSFTSHSGGSNWTFPTIETRSGAPYQGQFANYSVWTRTIDQDKLRLAITPFGNGKRTTVELTPRNGMIQLKVANLCAENPLEWCELDIRSSGDEDLDFKWLYRLMKNPTSVRPGLKGELPVPVLDQTGGVAGKEVNCTGGLIDGDI